MKFLLHESRLAWRDLVAMLTGGKRRKPWRILLGVGLFITFLHWLCLIMLQNGLGPKHSLTTYVSVTSAMLLSFLLMLSQAMESITRSFYTRGDLDIILSAPTGARPILLLRLTIQTIMVSFLSVLLIGPMLNVLAFTDSPRWLAGYGMALIMGFLATTFGLLMVIGLFHLVGQKRTRLVAQIVAAVIGAAFVIIVQLIAIRQTGTLSQVALLHDPSLLAKLPPESSHWWLPAQAAMGENPILLLFGIASLILYALVTWPLLNRFAYYSAQAASKPTIRAQRNTSFRYVTSQHALRRKEWLLILRDPWLASQTLMQLLYLLPPALLLWQSIGEGTDALLILLPVLVMASGQLAGGLAWITLSGEDAPDLLATAPYPTPLGNRAKLETVALLLFTLFAPFTLFLAYHSLWLGFVCAMGLVLAIISSVCIQFWFRSSAGRSQFRRRHTASRFATFAEAVCCVCWAGAATLIAMKTIFALAFVLLSLLILIAAYNQRTRR